MFVVRENPFIQLLAMFVSDGLRVEKRVQHDSSSENSNIIVMFYFILSF